MELEILKENNNPYLRQVCEEFDFSSDDPEVISMAMIDLMKKHSALGLAANQCGINKRIIAINSEPIYVMFNPRIVNVSGDEILLDEACLSFPGLIVPVKRAKYLKVRFTGPDGNTYTKDFNGITARTILHEIDHLNGVLFYNRANRYHREKAMRKWRK